VLRWVPLAILTAAGGVGTGLGLGIVYRLVEQYGGVIRFSSAPGYTEFIVKLPSEPQSVPEPSPGS